MNATIDSILSHRSIRKFTDSPIAQETVDQLVRCGQAAATSSNIQSVSVIQVTSIDKRQSLAELAGGQAYVASAPVFLVYCADMSRPRLACERQGGDFAPGMTEHFIHSGLVSVISGRCGTIRLQSVKCLSCQSMYTRYLVCVSGIRHRTRKSNRECL